jgi:hypothetical protein
MNGASRRMHQRGLVVAAVGIFLGVVSQAHWFVASQNYSHSRLPVERGLAAAAVSPSSGQGDMGARPNSVQSSINSDRSHAGDTRTFIIAAAAGYGIEECLVEGGECGKVVADAWCEIDGHRAAQKFGRSGEDFDRISKVSSSVPRPYFVTCRG